MPVAWSTGKSLRHCRGRGTRRCPTRRSPRRQLCRSAVGCGGWADHASPPPRPQGRLRRSLDRQADVVPARLRCLALVFVRLNLLPSYHYFTMATHPRAGHSTNEPMLVYCGNRYPVSKLPTQTHNPGPPFLPTARAPCSGARVLLHGSSPLVQACSDRNMVRVVSGSGKGQGRVRVRVGPGSGPR